MPNFYPGGYLEDLENDSLDDFDHMDPWDIELHSRRQARPGRRRRVRRQVADVAEPNPTKIGAYLDFLYHKYCEGGMSVDAWRELVYEATRTVRMQMFLIRRLATKGHVSEALYWVKRFGIAQVDCPNAVRRTLWQTPPANNGQGSSCDFAPCGSLVPPPRADNEASNPFLTWQLPYSSIILVDNRAKFLDMLMYLEQRSLIGFDSEYKPAAGKNNILAIIQLAVSDRVYLVDCLISTLSAKLWGALAHQIFNNPKIVKIGFSIDDDLRMLRGSRLPLKLKTEGSGYLDLCDLWRNLKRMHRVELPYGPAKQPGKSLAVLTELCLGKKLDKSNQISNWANRPLRQEQTIYAALDAHCLLEIYKIMVVRLEGYGNDRKKIPQDAAFFAKSAQRWCQK